MLDPFSFLCSLRTSQASSRSVRDNAFLQVGVRIVIIGALYDFFGHKRLLSQLLQTHLSRSQDPKLSR